MALIAFLFLILAICAIFLALVAYSEEDYRTWFIGYCIVAVFLFMIGIGLIFISS